MKYARAFAQPLGAAVVALAASAVLLISTELDEVLELGQRIAVLFRGRLVPVPAGAHSREAIGRTMLGEGAS